MNQRSQLHFLYRSSVNLFDVPLLFNTKINIIFKRVLSYTQHCKRYLF